MILSHIKQETCLPKDAIKCMLEKNPHIVSLIGGDREAVGISCFKDYHEYTEFMKKNHLYGKEMLSEKPVMFKLLTKNIKSRRFDFLDVTKRLLGE